MATSYDKFGPWTDFYALGATMYKLLTNQDPPSVSDLSEDETEDKHLALPMPNVSEEMKKLVVWMMQVNRLKRPKNVGEFRGFLHQPSAAPTSNNEETNAYWPYQSSANPASEDEETVLASKNGDAKVEEKAQPQSKVEEQASGDAASKNTHIVVVCILVVVVVCVIAFMTRGCGNVTTSNVNAVSADSDSVCMTQDLQKQDERPTYMENLRIKINGENCSYTGEVGYNSYGEVGPAGKGKVIFEDGRIYEGVVGACGIDGEDGTITYPNGDVFKGVNLWSYRIDKSVPDKGEYIWADGTRFVGTFDRYGKPKEGKWYNKDGSPFR